MDAKEKKMAVYEKMYKHLFDQNPDYRLLTEKLFVRCAADILYEGADDPFTGRIAHRGFQFAKAAESLNAPAKNCHCNALSFNREDSDYRVATGYALNVSMRLWIRHSWLWHRGATLETTPSFFDAYYGIVLSTEEVAEFQERFCHKP